MNNKILSIPINNFELTNEVNEEGLRKVKLYVCKDGIVPSHEMFIEKDAIIQAKDSLKNRPLLCAYEVDDEGSKVDFLGHEVEYVVYKENGQYKLKIEYIEQPVGHISELEDSITIEEIDGEYWCVANGYIYEDYCKDVINILQENDNEKYVSMEVRIIDSENNDKDGLCHIKSFRFKGVTILGEKHPPAISNARIEMFSQSDEFSLQFEKIINKIDLERGNKMNRSEIINKYNNLKNNVNFEKIINDDKLSDKELEDALFSLSVQDLMSKIREVLSKEKYIDSDYWGDSYECNKYWLRDVIIGENIVIVDDNEDYFKTYGISYTLSGDVITLDIENKVRYVRGDWRPYDEASDSNIVFENPFLKEKDDKNYEKAKDKELELENIKEELKEVKSSFTDLNTSNSNLKDENKTLEERIQALEDDKKEFERKEKEKEINEVVSNFSELSNIKGIEKILDKKFEYTPENLIKELKVFAYDNNIILSKDSNNEKFEKNNGNIKDSTFENKAKNFEEDEVSVRYGIDKSKYSSYEY